jgi:hypothetical protein
MQFYQALGFKPVGGKLFSVSSSDLESWLSGKKEIDNEPKSGAFIELAW